ncbi:MupA/Atu3671 family FMN-dependent luciferase-like monooxygenase [Paracoccus endophyticus]|uniref:MupA/Atu3671 family FMN-dependent luciferase-like monooxygenase n=1 Tax=Paracoccus endophyticus TaxID=2233774 RepID=UPI000DDBB7C4|nr:MupA/Atu3671 family FMN-dependent luciferase-like monooxygenase [Paracoccus endophyticus]
MTPFSAIVVGNESLLRHCTQRLIERGHAVRAVVTRDPDLARWATDAGLTVEDQDAPGDTAADWLFSIANLSLLPPAMLARGTRGAINFHDGPLPAMAGLNTPVWAILQGHARHGVSWHLIAGGVDEGDLLVTRDIALDPRETALTLNAKAYAAAADGFEDVMAMLETGALSPVAQDLTQRAYFARDRRPDAGGMLDWRAPAATLDALVRGLDHGPYWNPLVAPWVALPDGRAFVTGAQPAAGAGAPGAVLAVDDDGVTVAAGEGALRVALDGGTHGLAPGDRLPVADDAARAALTDVAARAARHDGWWRARLDRLVPAAWHGAAGDGGDPLPLPDHPLTLAAAVWALARLDGRDRIDVGLRPADLPEGPLAADWLPLGVDLTSAPTLGALADQIAAAQAGIAAHAFPLADLTRRAPELRDQAQPRLGVDLTGRATGADMDLWVTHGPAGWLLHPGRVPAQTAALAAQAITAILDQGADAALAGRPLMDEATARALTAAGNDTLRAVPDATIHDLIAATLARDPDRTALVFQDRSLTRAELDRASAALAVRLQALGVGPDQPVGLFARRGPELVIGALAILRAGGAYLPLDPDYPAERLAHYLADSGAALVLVQQGLAASLPASDAILMPIPAAIPDSAPAPAATARPDNLAYLIYTSGSTGRPKGVMVEHRNVVNFFAGIDDTIPAAEDDCLLAVTSLSFDISVLEIFWSLARGLKLVVAGEDSRLAVSGGTHGGQMDFSLFYWGNDDGPGPQKYRLLLDGARFADQNGFAAVWTPERHFHAFGGPYPNPAVSGAAVAAVTRNLSVRAGSCVLPLHHPARVAEDWAVIDNLTAGRAGLAVASGWQPEDFVLRPENTPPGNKAALTEGIDQLRRLWRGERVDFPSARGTQGVVTQPRPVQRELPLWLTIAGNPDTWIEAGRLGMHVLTHLLGQDIATVAARIRDYHGALREAGHDPRDFTVTLMLHSYLADSRDQAREIARGPMKSYLRSAAGLVKQFAWDFPAFRRPAGMTNPMAVDLGSLTEDELDGILEFAFLRYFDDSGLFGTVEDGIARVEQLRAIGVTEVACLIDYGIAPDVVMDGLPRLAALRQAVGVAAGPSDDDFSIAAQIVRHGVTHLQCTPSMARILLDDPVAARALGRLDCLMLGGEALPPALVAGLRAVTQAAIWNMYGPTETTIWSAVGEVTGAPVLVPGFANTQLYVLDTEGAPVPPGAEGELWIGGHGVTRGYWRRPDLTDAAFRPDPFVAPEAAAPGGARMYRTGDLVRRRADGMLDYVGRADHQVKLRGFRIELGEIESRLAAIPGVTEAVAIVREDSPGDRRLVAYVCGTEAPDEAAMRAALAADLPAHMLPGRIVALPRMPQTPNRKTDRKALPAPETLAARAAVVAPPVAAANAPAAPAAAPAVAAPPAKPGAVAEGVRRIWAETLGVAQARASDNFFASGGHSLLAIQLHRTLRDGLGLSRLAVTDIFRFPVLGDFIRHAESLSPRPAPAALAPAAGVAMPPAASGQPAAPQAQAPQPAPQHSPAAAEGDSDPMARRRALREQFRRGL